MHQNDRTVQKHYRSEAMRDWDYQSAPQAGEPSVAARVRERAIRELAYAKWEAAGRPAGDGVQFWLEAERELMG